jgi:hypothetical protein
MPKNEQEYFPLFDELFLHFLLSASSYQYLKVHIQETKD